MGDDTDHWVLDDDFVRGGRPEPPARTRAAIARYGGQQTSWRQHGNPAGADNRIRPAGHIERRLGNAAPRSRGWSRTAKWVTAMLGCALAWIALARWTDDRGMGPARLTLPGVSGTERIITPQPTSNPTAPDPQGNVVHGISPSTPIGACFISPAGPITRTQSLMLHEADCRETHTFQLVSIDQATGSSTAYPSDAYWEDSVAPACRQEFAAFTHQSAGIPPPGQAISYFRPTQSGWSMGDRTVYCVLHAAAPVAGSAQH